MITFQQLTKQFGTQTAVDHLNLNIQSGEIFGFLGPNGAGKTTTIRLMTGLFRPTEGTVIYECDGKTLDIQKHSQEILKRVGYIPDTPFLYEKLTGREHIRFHADVFGMPERGLEEKISELVDLFSLRSVQDQPIEGYSHGMKQKVVIASALIHAPSFLIVDEPMVGLDPPSMRLVKNLFRHLANEKGTTVFLSTHSLDMVEEVCDRIGILSQGKLIALGTRDELWQRAQTSDPSLESIFMELLKEEI